MALTLEGLLALFKELKSDNDILKARVDELEKDALLTETDLEHTLEYTRNELKGLKSEFSHILMAINHIGGAAAAAPMPAAAAPMPAVAMAGGGAPTTLKITLLKDVNLQTFLPKLPGETSRSELIGANKEGAKPNFGFICVNFASAGEATFTHDMLRDQADPAYKVGYKQAKAK